MILGIAFFSYIMGNFNDVLTNYEKKMNANSEPELQKWITSLCKFTYNAIYYYFFRKIYLK